MYTCERCHHATPHKCNLVTHLRKKRSCPTEFSVRDVAELLEELTHRDDSQMQFSCPFCSKKFRHRSNVSHHKRCCPKRPALSETSAAPTASAVGLGSTTNVCTASGTGTASIVDNSTTVNNNTTVILLPFGRETRFHVEQPECMLRFLRKGEAGICDLIELKHFHPDHPENHNIRCSNLHAAWVHVYSGAAWKVRTKDDVIRDLVEAAQADLLDFYDDIKSDIRGALPPIHRAQEAQVRAFGRLLQKHDDAQTTVKVPTKNIVTMLYNATKQRSSGGRRNPSSVPASRQLLMYK